VSVARTP
jgi:hypothetical protein